MKHSFLILTFFISFIPLSIYGTAPKNLITHVRHQQLFDMHWLFIRSDNPDYRNVNYNDSSWRKLNIPHDWSIELPYAPKFPAGKNNGYFQEGIGWYRKHFSIDKSKRDKEFVIQFDGVFANSEVWINGHYLGRRPSGYVTFRYDITRFLKLGGDNMLAVRVDDSNPGADRWYHGSGIYRDVYLIKTNYTHFRLDDGIHITVLKAEKDEAIVDMHYTIMGSYFTDKEIKTYGRNAWIRDGKHNWKVPPVAHDCMIRTTVYDSDGNEVAHTEDKHIIYNYTAEYRANQLVTVPKPHRWSDKGPYLYKIKSELLYQGKVLDDVETSYGIRKLEYIPNKGLFVNGRMTKLRGVCLHQTTGAAGAAMPDKLLEYRLKHLKAIGCNAIRTSHNPFSPTFYRMCDKLGFYLMDECFDEWNSGWGFNYTENPMGKAMNGYDLYFDQWADTDLRDMIRRDCNHACVIMYSVGNEIPNWRHDAKAGEEARHLVAICHRYDATRPVAIGNNADIPTQRNGVMDAMDILGFNYIKRDRSDKMYSVEHERYPNKLCFGSETTKDLSYFLTMRENDYVIGQFIWTGFDYLGETHEPLRRGYNSGLIDLPCHLRANGAKMDCAWNENPRIHLLTSQSSANAKRPAKLFTQAGNLTYESLQQSFSWNWKEKGNPFVIVYSNCEKVELLLNGKLIGRKKNDFSEYEVEWQVPYQKGKLEAIGYNNGQKVCQDVLYSTSKASKIIAKPVWKSMKLNGRDIDILEVTLVDKKGHHVPDATNSVQVDVNGSARVLGIDTQNLFYDGIFQTDQRYASGGRMQVLIKSKEGNEPVEIKLSSPGLKSAVVKLEREH